jgi:rare lipoprotein A
MKILAMAIVAVGLLCGCSSNTQKGEASYYSDTLHGKKTASGEPYDRGALTAAHKTWKLGTMVRVTNVGNGKSIVVRINDRGPYAKGRIIDLSRAAAEKLDFIKKGVTEVKLEIVE